MIYQWIAFLSISACGILFSIWRNAQAVAAKKEAADLKVEISKIQIEKEEQSRKYEQQIDLLHNSLSELRKELDAVSTPASVLGAFNRLFPPKP